MFQNKVAVVTGGANGIGKRICGRFSAEGANVCVIDICDNPYFKGDLSRKEDIEAFVQKVLHEHTHIDYLINNALPQMVGITNGSYQDFEYALKVGVTAPFYLSKLFAPHFNPGGSIVNISSTRAGMSQPQTESYAAAKGGIAALTHALSQSLRHSVRVNSISPGWIDTHNTELEPNDHKQHPAGRVGTPDDIASMVLYLCSDQAGFITGTDITIDGGMTKQMIYHNDNGWRLES